MRRRLKGRQDRKRQDYRWGNKWVDEEAGNLFLQKEVLKRREQIHWLESTLESTRQRRQNQVVGRNLENILDSICTVLGSPLLVHRKVMQCIYSIVYVYVGGCFEEYRPEREVRRRTTGKLNKWLLCCSLRERLAQQERKLHARSVSGVITREGYLFQAVQSLLQVMRGQRVKSRTLKDTFPWQEEESF